MTSNRPYRSALTREYALSELKANAGTQFCSEIVDIFIAIISSMTEDLYLMISNGKSDTTVPVE